jgi:cysteine-rich repeat protein
MRTEKGDGAQRVMMKIFAVLIGTTLAFDVVRKYEGAGLTSQAIGRTSMMKKNVVVIWVMLSLGGLACGEDVVEPVTDTQATPDTSVNADVVTGGDASLSCEAPLADCDSDEANGCETNTATDTDHCGQCGNACAIEHGSGQCVDSACVFTCDEGFSGDDCSEKTINCEGQELTCDANASCEVVDGTPACKCNEFYEGDGAVCTPICGDEVPVGNEVCDDGNTIAGDGCRADCAGLEVCGDGQLDTAVDEECDDANLDPGDGCDDRCEKEPEEGPCGDGIINIGEECDDANDDAADGCDGCLLSLTDAWTCDPAVFKAGDGCDCGCGQVDADCEDATVGSCSFCGGEGTCNPQDAACQKIDPDSNDKCK